MSKKCQKTSYLAVLVLVIGIIAIISAYAYFGYESAGENIRKNITNNEHHLDNSNLNNSNIDRSIEIKGKEIAINGLKCLIPNSYQKGSIVVKPGINTYEGMNGSIYITVYNNSNEGNAVYNGDLEYFAYGKFNEDNNPKRENITLEGHDILYVTQHSDIRGNYRLTYFKVNDKKVMIEYLGNELTDDIKTIILSFYKLN
ncbi:MAG: hypothetical protein LBM26_02455 [Methanobrevibacter sp.]|jgi:hypothetical protein|nr:hypothetical protein [Methanobrevibacter sp.]